MPASQSQHEIAPACWLAGWRGLTPYFSCCCLPGARLSPVRARRKRAAEQEGKVGCRGELRAQRWPRKLPSPHPCPAGAAQIWTRGVPAESGRLNYFCTNIFLNVVVKLFKAFSCRGFYLDGRKSIIVTSSCAGRRLIHILTKLNVFILFRNFKYFSFREHQPSQTNKQILRQQFSSDQFFVWMN